MKVIFKNVGHGDTIIIEWKSQNGTKIGIIDCNDREGLNPCLEHLLSGNYKSVDFIILSHPHEDHYSGLNDFLDYCKNQKIIIANFYHTMLSNLLGIMLKYDSKSEQKKLKNTFKKIDTLYRNGIIKAVKNIDSNSKNIILNSQFEIEIFHPDYDASKKLIDNDRKYLNGYSNTRPNFNEIATILSVTNHSDYFLLTSDGPKKSFGKLLNYNKRLIGGQAAHHGSIYNLSKKYWSKVTRQDNSPIFISVGKSQWNLPDKETIEFYSQNGYVIKATNNVGGLIKDSFNIIINKKKSHFLNNFSSLQSSNINLKTKGRDQIFTYP